MHHTNSYNECSHCHWAYLIHKIKYFKKNIENFKFNEVHYYYFHIIFVVHEIVHGCTGTTSVAAGIWASWEGGKCVGAAFSERIVFIKNYLKYSGRRRRRKISLMSLLSICFRCSFVLWSGKRHWHSHCLVSLYVLFFVLHFGHHSSWCHCGRPHLLQIEIDQNISFWTAFWWSSVGRATFVNCFAL